MKVLLATLAAALAAPASALAAGPSMTVRTVPLHAGPRALAAAPPRFNLVAVHWRGTGTVAFRARTAGGWSTWRTADADVSPDARSGENRLRTWRLGDPVWTGTATAIRFRTHGRVTQLRAYYIWSPTERILARRLTIANAPPIIPRLSWGADESIRRAKPQIATALRFAVVHHTAGSNAYSPAESAAIVRGIELYHVEGNGWNDIGYNFLVDRYGQVFEGRYGGIDKPVIGAHALGFNTGSVGVALIGDYGSAPISAAAQAALEQLLAWRLDLAHIDPLSFVTVASGGNPRFPSGIPVILRAISGHRDTNFTDCPGSALYAQLPQIAKDVAALGGPKIYSPLVSGKLEGPVLFTAQLSRPLPWTVTVADPSGAVVAQGSGTGSSVGWTWDTSSVPSQKYTWTIAAPGARSATGSIGSGTAGLALQKLTATPSLLAPGGDPTRDTTTISYLLTVPAMITATLLDANGQVVSTSLSAPEAAGSQTFTFTESATQLAGNYTVQLVAATATGKTVTATTPLTIDDLLSGFTLATAPVFSAATQGAASVSFTLTRLPASSQFQAVKGSGVAAVVADPPVPPLAVGPNTFTWNGRLDDGTLAPDGTYTLTLTLTDQVATVVRTATVTLDSTPPKVTVLSYAATRFRIGEASVVTLVVGTTRYTRTLTHPQTVAFRLAVKPRAYRLIATDAAGNTTVVRYRAK